MLNEKTTKETQDKTEYVKKLEKDIEIIKRENEYAKSKFEELTKKNNDLREKKKELEKEYNELLEKKKELTKKKKELEHEKLKKESILENKLADAK